MKHNLLGGCNEFISDLLCLRITPHAKWDSTQFSIYAISLNVSHVKSQRARKTNYFNGLTTKESVSYRCLLLLRSNKVWLEDAHL